jgi:regulator of sigma D
MRVLNQNLRIARGFKPMTEQELQALREQLADAASDGHFELYKTTAIFDGDEGRRAHGFPTSKELSA